MNEKNKKTIEIFDKLIDSGISQMVLDSVENFIFVSYNNIMKENLNDDWQMAMEIISVSLQKTGLVEQKIQPTRLLVDALHRFKIAIKECGYDGLLELVKTKEFESGFYNSKKVVEVAIKYNITLNGTLQNDINKLQLNSNQKKGRSA